MNVLQWIGGILKPAKDLVTVFKEDEEQKAQRKHAEVMADSELNAEVLQQFAAEFSGRANRTWWDSLVDGLNRLPRPMIAIGILAFFIIAPLYPDHFLKIASAYEKMPDGFWTLLAVIIGFYFGGRMQLKSQDFKVKGAAVGAAKQLMEKREDFKSFVMDDEPPEEKVFRAAEAQQGGRKPNATAKQWKKEQGDNHPANTLDTEFGGFVQ